MHENGETKETEITLQLFGSFPFMLMTTHVQRKSGSMVHENQRELTTTYNIPPKEKLLFHK